MMPRRGRDSTGRNEHKKGPKAAPTASSSEASFNMSCMQCRRPSLNAKANAQSRADQAKQLRDALYKMSDTLVGSLVVVTVVDEKKQANSEESFPGEFDRCHECAEEEPTSPRPTSSPSGTSWSSIAT